MQIKIWLLTSERDEGSANTRLRNEPGVSKVKVGAGDSVVTEVECITDVNDWWWRAAGSGVMWQSSLHQ